MSCIALDHRSRILGPAPELSRRSIVADAWWHQRCRHDVRQRVVQPRQQGKRRTISFPGIGNRIVLDKGLGLDKPSGEPQDAVCIRAGERLWIRHPCTVQRSSDRLYLSKSFAAHPRPVNADHILARLRLDQDVEIVGPSQITRMRDRS
jgi:hypothetical protein